MTKRKFIDDEKKDIFRRLFVLLTDIKDCKVSLFDSSEADLKKITSEVIGISVVAGRRITRNMVEAKIDEEAAEPEVESPELKKKQGGVRKKCLILKYVLCGV